MALPVECLPRRPPMRRKPIRHLSFAIAALSILLGIVSPVVSPFFVNTAAGANDPEFLTKLETIHGGYIDHQGNNAQISMDPDVSKRVYCQAYVEKDQLTDALIGQTFGWGTSSYASRL